MPPLLKRERLMAENPQNPRVLLVEDEEDLRELFAEVLGTRFSVETASNGGVALARLQNEAFALLITDLQLPIMGGSELLRRFQTMPARQQTAVVAISANPQPLARVARAGTADQTLRKPFRATELVRCAMRLVSEGASAP